MQLDEEMTDLKKENEALKERLQEYQSLEEDLMAERVFEKARKKLTLYITLGGLIFLLSSVIGVKTVTDYVKDLANNLAKEKIENIIATNEIKQKLIDVGERRITELVDEQRKHFSEMAQQQMSRIIAATQPIGKSEITVSAPSLIGVLDYTNKMTPVRDQGMEGSSVGFAVAAALEYQIEKVLGQRVVISPRYIYYYARLKGGQATEQDSGANIRDAIKVLSELGAVAEDVWPYKAGEFDATPPDSIEQAQHYKILESQTLRNTNEIKSALERFGPIVGGFVMYSSAWSSDEVKKTGKIPMPSPSDSVRGAAAVCFVGYDDNQKLLKFKNSWGKAWGDQGYGYISYEYADKFLTDAWAISMERAEGQ